MLAEGQAAQTGAPSARRPLIARPMMPPQVGRRLRAQSLLGVEVLHVHLDEAEGRLHLPRPVRRMV
ncbi:MAG: hypothetical protein DDG58_09490 [Ardenticatenia bacterium]|nr:MAG: hypothetical protein DDG58_09490 [Ardenticatenia bacterium]